MDGKLSLPTRLTAYVIFPIALLILVPLLLMFVVIFYLLALLQGVRSLGTAILGIKDELEPSLQKPHFLESSVASPPVPRNETRQPS
jgi:hypothetical protein